MSTEGIHAGTIFIPKVRQFKWAPKEDITAYELAKLQPFFFYAAHGNHEMICHSFDELPDECKRHIEETEQDIVACGQVPHG